MQSLSLDGYLIIKEKQLPPWRLHSSRLERGSDPGLVLVPISPLGYSYYVSHEINDDTLITLESIFLNLHPVKEIAKCSLMVIRDFKEKLNKTFKTRAAQTGRRHADFLP